MTERAVPARSGTGPSSPADTGAPAIANGHVGLWQQFFASASPAERLAWLASADPAGVVYPHRHPSAREARPHLLDELLANRLAGLLPWSSDSLIPDSAMDAALDSSQRDAVRRALASPDVFLLAGAPGTGKSRVVAEVISHVAAAGQRVLFLSPGRGALDVVLDRLGTRPGVLAVRCLGAGESEKSLSPAVQRLTFAAWQQRVQHEPEERRQSRADALQTETTALRRDRELLAPLGKLATENAALEHRRREIDAHKQLIASRVEPFGQTRTPLAAQLESEVHRHRQALATLQEELQKAEAEHAERSREHERRVAQRVRQERTVAARTQGSIFRLSWWRGLFQGRAHERLQEFQSREREAAEASEKARARCEELKERRVQEEQRHATAVEQLRQNEISRLHAEADLLLDELTRQQGKVLEQWNQRRAELVNPAALPVSPEEHAVIEALRTNEDRLQRLQGQAKFLDSWRGALRELQPRLPELMRDAVNVVAAGCGDIAGDSQFGDRAASPLLFDLVVLEQADRLPEAELLAHARRGLRCVLVGQTPLSEGHRRESERTASRTSTAFHRLWLTLHCDPRRLPYQWLESPSRLTCKMLPAGPEANGRCESERLVDHPDVELRILSRPNQGPALAEVVFPVPQFAIDTAKAYLYQNLGELTLRPGAAALRWREEPDRLVLDLADNVSSVDREKRVELSDGVAEFVVPSRGEGGERDTLLWGTSRLEFDRARAWDRLRAEAWVRERASLLTLDRTALLDTQWRASPELALKISSLFGEPPPRTGNRSHSSTRLPDLLAAVHFLAVPYRRERPRIKHRGPHRPAQPPAKALEIDLADPKQRQRLPLEVQLRLPQKGIVNFAEAQAIVHLLDETTQAGTMLRLAVLSWQLPQVQFLEALWAKHDAVSGKPPVQFDTPAGFRDREADVVFLSLCRSNSQRGIGYCDSAEEWRWVLAAARQQIVVLGDGEMLARRAGWDGPVSRQTEFAAHVEKRLLHTLLRDTDHTSPTAVAVPGART
jgi:hypothetical protein